MGARGRWGWQVKRLHLFEVVDLPWCPAAVRDGLTDFLGLMMNSHKGFNVLAPRLLSALSRVGETRIVDLCSGAGGPWPTLQPEIEKSLPITVTFTDLFPNPSGLDGWKSNGCFSVVERAVDARRVPSDLSGLRTIMSGFHHFAPDQARAILEDAVRQRRAIVVFEGSDSRGRGLAMMTLLPTLMFLFMPLVRPFRLSRLLLTYIMPVLPVLGLWDGCVSMLRTYSPAELRELIEEVEGHQSFEWDVGTERAPGSPLGLTYLVGVPQPGAASLC